MNISNELRSIIQWENPNPEVLFYKYTDRGDEIKNASKLVLLPGQACLFTYEGRIEGVFEDEGTYDLHTDNIPFITTLKSFFSLYEGSQSLHKTGFWFYRKADMMNLRWGTRSPIKYNDPVYTFPVSLRAFGNYSIRITEPYAFFTKVVAGADNYTVGKIQELFLSRIMQPISNYLANAKFSYVDIDSNLENIAKNATEKTEAVFLDLGFSLTDFRIEGTSFDEDTQARIGKISDMNADVQAAKLAGLDYAQLEQVKAMRDSARNEGLAGLGNNMAMGMQFGSMMNQNQAAPPVNQQPAQTQNADDPMQKLKKLKDLFSMELITEEEYNGKKKEILDKM